MKINVADRVFYSEIVNHLRLEGVKLETLNTEKKLHLETQKGSLTKSIIFETRYKYPRK